MLSIEYKHPNIYKKETKFYTNFYTSQTNNQSNPIQCKMSLFVNNKFQENFIFIKLKPTANWKFFFLSFDLIEKFILSKLKLIS